METKVKEGKDVYERIRQGQKKNKCHSAEGHSLKTFTLLVLMTMYITVGSSQSVLSQFTAPNPLDVVITTGQGNLKLHSNNMLASYKSVTRCFTFRLPIDQFEVIQEPSLDRRLLRSFKKEKRERANLVMSVCIGESSIGLDKLERKGEFLPVTVNFGDFSFQNEAQVWALISGENMLLRIMISKTFSESVELLGNRKLPIKLIELRSTRIQINNFRDFVY